MFYLWRRLGEEDKQRVWRLYGWYTALMVCGSCVGAVTWAAKMMYNVTVFSETDVIISNGFVERLSVVATSFDWLAFYVVTYAIEFLCLSTAELMVLERMSDFAAPQGDSARRWWFAGGRIIMAAVVVGNSAGLAASVAAAVHFQKVSKDFRTASTYFASNDNSNAEYYMKSGDQQNRLATYIFSVNNFCEVAVLILVVAAFAVVGIVSVHRISSALYVLETSGPEIAESMMLRRQIVGAAKALGRQLRLEVVVTTVFVFAAFLLRSVLSTMLAVAFKYQDFDRNECLSGNVCDELCYNEYTHLTQWNLYTPEFQPTVVLISSPLALLVALWGMTPKLTLQLLRRHKRQPVQLKTVLARQRALETL
jgi:hypothetical protein